MPTPATAARFWAKVNKTPTCWLWTGASANGYGVIRFDRRQHYAHRLVFDLIGSSIPVGMEVDHLCRVRRCVNPAHLEPVTPAENRRRQRDAWIASHPRCSMGHDEWRRTRDKRGTRVCQACRRDTDERRIERRHHEAFVRSVTR